MLTQEEFIALLQVGRILYFLSDQITSKEPHYHVIIHTYRDGIYFSCFTTQHNNRRRFMQLQNIPDHCLVEINCTDKNELNEISWIDCNSHQLHFHDELWELYQNRKLTVKGTLNNPELNLIYNGIRDSPLFEEEKKEIICKELP